MFGGNSGFHVTVATFLPSRACQSLAISRNDRTQLPIMCCAETDFPMASGQADGRGGPPGPQDDGVDDEGEDDISEDFMAQFEEIKEIGDNIDLEIWFRDDELPVDERGLEEGIRGEGRPGHGQVAAASELVPDGGPQGRESKASPFSTGVDYYCSSIEEVSEIVESERWHMPSTSNAAAVLGSKTHPESGLDAKEPPDRGPAHSKGSRVATPRTIGHDCDEEPRDPEPSDKTSRAASPKLRELELDSDEGPWDRGPSSKGSRAAALKTTGLEGLHDLGQQDARNNDGRAFRKANTSNEEPRDRGPKSKTFRSLRKTTSLNVDELPRDRGPNTTRPAIASLKTTGMDSDEESDDEPLDRGPDTKPLQAAGLKTTGLGSDDESPGNGPNRYETSTTLAVTPDNISRRNEQMNTVSIWLVSLCSHGVPTFAVSYRATRAL